MVSKAVELTPIDPAPEKKQSMEDILKQLNETIAQQQAQINMLLATQKEKIQNSDEPVITPPEDSKPVVTPPKDPKEAPKSEDSTPVIDTKPENTPASAGSSNPNKRKISDAKQDNKDKQVKVGKFDEIMMPFWDDIQIKVDEGKDEDTKWWIDDDVAEKIRLIREDTIYKAKVIMSSAFNVFEGHGRFRKHNYMYGSKQLPGKKFANFSITCSKVKEDEASTFHSTDMVKPDLRNFDQHKRENPHEALTEFVGDSLLRKRYNEIVALLGPRRATFICCSTKKGFVSFYDLSLAVPDKPFLTQQHYITLELKHLLINVSGANLRLIRGILEEATDPSEKGIQLYQNFKHENRGNVLECRILKAPQGTDSNIFQFHFVDHFCSQRGYSGKFLFNDSAEEYKRKIAGDESKNEVIEVVPDDGTVEDVVQVVDDGAVDGADEEKMDFVVVDEEKEEESSVECIDGISMDNRVIPINS